MTKRAKEKTEEFPTDGFAKIKNYWADFKFNNRERKETGMRHKIVKGDKSHR